MELQNMLDHDKSMIKDIVCDYIQKSWINISTLHEAVKTKNYTTIQKIACQMCSASAYLGAEQFSEFFGIIEKYADQQAEEKLHLSMAVIDEEMNKVVAELKKNYGLIGIRHEVEE